MPSGAPDVMFPGGFLTSAFEESQATSACAAVYVTGYIHHFEIKIHNTQVVKVAVNKIFSSWWICSPRIMRKVLMRPAFPHCSSTLQLPLEKRLKEQLFFEARGDSPEKKARHGWPWMAGLKICFGLLVIGMCPLFPEGCDQWWQGLVGSWSRGEQSED